MPFCYVDNKNRRSESYDYNLTSKDYRYDLSLTVTLYILSDRFGYGCLEESVVTAVRASLNDDVIPRHLQFLENIAARSKSGWIAGTEGKITCQYF